MAIYTLAELRTRLTRAQATDTLIGVLAGLGFPTASWGPNSVPRALLEIASVAVEYASNYAATIADFGFLATSWGVGLTEFAKSHYDVTRIPATRGKYLVRLTTEAGKGPYPLAMGAITISDGQRTAKNDVGVTLTGGSYVDVAFTSDVVGLDGAITVGSVFLGTPIAGVTLTCTQTTAPINEESDAALKQRCSTKWAALAIELTDDGIINVIRNSGTGSLMRVAVDSTNPRGAGTTDVRCATATGAPSPTEIAAAVAALEKRAIGSVGEASTDQWLVMGASPVTVTWAWTVYLTPGAVAATVKTAVEAAVRNYINSIPIGGLVIPGVGRIVPLNSIIAAMQAIPGVSHVVLTTPSADVTLTPYQVAVCSSTFPAIGSYVSL
jgi:phage-related baseplate assembly protein